MIIILHGENNFFTKRKEEEIIARYKAKHPQGLSFFVFDEGSDLADVRAAIETLSLFEIKKLIICKSLISGVAGNAAFFTWLKERGIKETNDVVVVFSERGVREVKKNKNLEWLFMAPTVVQVSEALTPAQLPVWIKKEAAVLGADIHANAIQELILSCGNDLWRLSHELQKLSLYAPIITREYIREMVAQNPEGQIFEAVSALAQKKCKQAAEHFSALIEQGEEWPMMFGMIMYQFRGMVRVKDMLDRGVSLDAIPKELGMHPFAVKKIIPLVRTRSYEELVRFYGGLREMDYQLKTGGMTFDAAWERLLLV